MGVAGIDGDRGISDYHQADSRVKRAASKRADRVIVAADQSKLGRVTFISIAALSRRSTSSSPTATPTTPRWSPRASAGVEVICVDGIGTADRVGTGEVGITVSTHTIGIDVGTTGTKTVLFDTATRHRRPGLARDRAALPGPGYRRGRHRSVAPRTSSTPSGRC